MAKRVGKKGRIIAVEPDIDAYESLQVNLKLNDLINEASIRIALGESRKEGILRGGGLDGLGLIRNSETIDVRRVEIMPGDVLVQDEKLPLPNVVKIDVEGYEYYVIRGLRNPLSNRDCHMVCVEMHPMMFPQGITCEMIIELLQSYNFNHINTKPRAGTFHAFCYKSSSPQ